MLQSGYINFFNVNKCGLYRLFSEVPKALELSETFQKLEEWRQGRNFEATNPWDPTKKRNKTSCYFKACHFDKQTGDYLLVLWKGDSDRHGPLYGISINPDGTTGAAVKQTQTNSKIPMVWGRPCYYWIIPEVNCIASIKFENSRCDSAMFQDWVNGCMSLRVPLDEYKQVTTETGLRRIQFPDEEKTPYRYSFQFDLSLRTLSTAAAKMTELAQRVTHIIRRETVSIKNQDKRRGWAKFFKRFDVPFTSAIDNSSRRVELRIEAKPTVEELKEIIDEHAMDRENGGWEDTGFVLDNSSRTVWAGSYRLTENIAIEDHGIPVLDPKALYNKISENRANYIAPILKDNLLTAQAAAHA